MGSQMSRPEPKALVVPSATVFAASLCIMVLELTAGRLIASYLGFSLYTWTSVIGTVLTGIAFGSWFGGRVADRFRPQQALVALFFLAAVGCGVVPVLNQVIGGGLRYVNLYWPAKILLHVAGTFLFPSVLLGMVSPVVAKWALDQGLRTGRTVGDVYAWSAVGSIVGTFLAGFVLIPALGTVVIMECIAAILAGLGLLFLVRGRAATSLVVIFTLLATGGMASQGWAFGTGRGLLFGSKSDPNLLYERESQYSYIRVDSVPNAPGLRILKLDSLSHATVDMRDPGNINSPHQYNYLKLVGAVTRLVAGQKAQLRTLFLGGGGYVWPRYIEKIWPGSHIEVVEIDPEVTEAAIQALGLARDHSMQIVHLDVRNHIADLVLRRREGEAVGNFDAIYGDTFNDLVVPFQLTTLEFNEELRSLLAPDGVYILNLIDSITSGRFLGAELNTLRRVFPYVTVFSVEKQGTGEEGDSNTFILVSALRQIEFDQLESGDAPYRQMDEAQLKFLEERSRGMILTDDYAPVENLMASVKQAQGRRVDRSAVARRLIDEGIALVNQGRFDEGIARYRQALTLGPEVAEGAHYNIAELLVWQGKFDEAIIEYRKALGLDPNSAEFHIRLADALSHQQKFDEAGQHYDAARRIDPDSVKIDA